MPKADGRGRAQASRKEPAKTAELKLGSGTKVALDGDLVFLIDALYRDFAVKRGFAPDYADLQKEIARVLEQMGPDATREYFAASLFLNYVTYENEMAERLADKITSKARRATATRS